MVNDLFCMCCWIQFASTLWRICNYIHQGYWPIVLFPGSSLFWLWYYSNANLIKPIWEHSFLFFFCKSFDNDLVLSVFCKILQWSCLVLVFLVRGIFDYPFSLLINKWSVQIFYFFWVSLAGYMFFFCFFSISAVGQGMPQLSGVRVDHAPGLPNPFEDPNQADLHLIEFPG